MITKLKTLYGIHGLDAYEWSGKPLAKYALLFGWNGSGKTTFSNILYCMKHKELLADFADINFQLQADAKIFSQAAIMSHDLSLEVFNVEFINKNVHFNQSGAEPIVMIGNENIKLFEEVETEQALLAEKMEKHHLNQAAFKKLSNPDEILSAAAKEWRQIASDLSVSGDKYFGSSFKITHVKALLERGEITKDNIFALTLDTETEAQLRQSVRTDWKEIPTEELEIFALEDIYKAANEIFATVISVQKLPDIELLNEELQEWVEAGTRLHEGQENCSFCLSPLTTNRLNSLKAQFTDTLAETNSKLDNLLADLKLIDPERVCIDSNSLMPTFRQEFVAAKNDYDTNIKLLQKELDKLGKQLEDKRKYLTDPNKTFETHVYPTELISSLNTTEGELLRIIKEHNSKVKSADTENNTNLKNLLLNCLSSQLQKHDYFIKEAEYEERRLAIEKADGEIKTATTTLDAKKAELNDQKIAVDKINGLLSNFFDNKKLCFQPKVIDGVTTYEIIRRGKKASNLSEGEKSVIALAYFLVTLESSTSEKLSNSTVVIDDPIDSQDSNFLFRTYGVISRVLKDAKQIIILTHNYEFFNIVRDWFIRFKDESSFTIIERSIIGGKETMQVSDLPDLLLEYKTEYHYLFFNLFGYAHDKKSIEAPLVANIARKVLEYYSSFKWSCRTSLELADRIQGLYMGEGATPEQRALGEAIYKFVNEYSHAQDPFRPIAITSAEAKVIAKNVLDLIKDSDFEHFKALKRLCNRQLEATNTPAQEPNKARISDGQLPIKEGVGTSLD